MRRHRIATDEVSNRLVMNYGFGYVNGNNAFLFVPRSLLEQLPLKPGASAETEVVLMRNGLVLKIRAKKGIESATSQPVRFTAVVRFPNKPGQLLAFLHLLKGSVGFLSIRTLANLGEEAEVIFEGFSRAANLGNETQMRRHLQTKIKKSGATLVHLFSPPSPRQYPTRIATAHYLCSLRLFRNSFIKATLSFLAGENPLDWEEGRLMPLGMTLDVLRNEILVRALPSPSTLLILEADDLKHAPPVTEAVLRTLPDGTNVEAITAYEYAAYDSERYNPAAGESLRPKGIIEILCTGSLPLEENEFNQKLSVLLGKDGSSFSNVGTRIIPLGGSSLGSPEGIFTKLLNDGRYVFLEELGKGAAGRVSRYLDLHTRGKVAAKHILRDFNPQEVQALVDARFKKANSTTSSRFVVNILDFFYNEEDEYAGRLAPVIVMEDVTHTLSAHFLNPKRDVEREAVNLPNDLPTFARMAIDLCRGLEEVHSGSFADGEGRVHRDVKPSNIGVSVVGGQAHWKLLDLGLARRVKLDAAFEETTTIWGTTDYMSPQAFLGQVAPANDIYALGIVLFQILHAWQHPSACNPGGIYRSRAVPREVADFLNCKARNSEWDERTMGFPENRWSPQSPFRRDSTVGEKHAELRPIIFRMIALSPDLRYGQMSEVRRDLELWRSKCAE